MAGSTFAEGARDTCPDCGEPIRVAAGRRAIDKPFFECLGCGAFVPRPGANEWDLLPRGERARHVTRATAIALATGVAFGLAYVAFALGQGRGWQPAEALVFVGAGVAVGGFAVGSRLVAAIQRSRRRLGDPMYRARLIEFEMGTAATR
jgi:hypothetical protein